MAAIEERADGINSDQITPEQLLEIAGWRAPPALSLYLPTGPSRTNVQTDKIRLKNLLKQAEARLQEAGADPRTVSELLSFPGSNLQDAHYWSYQGLGLVFFIARGLKRSFRLPHAVPETAHIGDTFYLKPLVPGMAGERDFFVLTLAQRSVRLFAATDHTIGEVPLPGLPPIDEALGFDLDEQQLQLYTQRRAGITPRGAAVFFGHADSEQNKMKSRCRQYFQQVDQKLHELLKDRSAPLVLAGVEYLLPIYREVNSYPVLLDDTVNGSPERMSLREIHQQAAPKARPFFEKKIEHAMSRYQEIGDRARTSAVLQEIVPAAARGQIDTLFVSPEAQAWGLIDEEAGHVELHDRPAPGDRELLDFAAVHTYVNKGSVYALPRAQMPEGREVAAILRYPLR